MTVNIFRASILLVTLFLSSGCNNGASKQRRQIEDAMRQAFSSTDLRAVLTGPQVVTTESTDYNKKQISQEDFLVAKAWSEAGLVDIKEEDVLSNDKDFSFNDFFARTQNGHLKRLIVTPTDLGKRLSNEANPNSSQPYLTWALLGQFKFARLISYDFKDIGANHYCIANGLATRTSTAAGEKIYKALKQPDATYKIIALFKHDPFADKWTCVASDSTTDGKSFVTDDVNEALSKASK